MCEKCNKPEHFEETGRYYGYHTCCINSFIQFYNKFLTKEAAAKRDPKEFRKLLLGRWVYRDGNISLGIPVLCPEHRRLFMTHQIDYKHLIHNRHPEAGPMEVEHAPFAQFMREGMSKQWRMGTITPDDIREVKSTHNLYWEKCWTSIGTTKSSKYYIVK